MGKGLKIGASIEEARLIRATAAAAMLDGTEAEDRRRLWGKIHRSADKAIRWFEDDDAPEERKT